MNLRNYLSLLLFFLSVVSNGQVLCINCYSQNAPLSANVTNLVRNGSFENYSGFPIVAYICPNSSNYNGDADYWSCTNGGVWTYVQIVHSTTYFFIADGTHTCYMGNAESNLCSPVEWDTSCKVRDGCTISDIPPGFPKSGVAYGDTAGVSIIQMIYGLIPGDVYVLEFWSGGESDGMGWISDGVFALDIGTGNIFLGCPPTPPGVGIGRRFIIQFAATADTLPLKFTNWGHNCASCTEVVLDDIRIYPVTELSSIIPACSLGERDPEKENIEVRFDPSARLFTVGKLNRERIDLKIFNVAGALVNNYSFFPDESIDLSALNEGLYLYEISTGKEVSRGKFIAE